MRTKTQVGYSNAPKLFSSANRHTFTRLFRGNIRFKTCAAIIKEMADVSLESVFDNLLKILNDYDIMYAKSIQKSSDTKNTLVVYTNAGYTPAATCDILMSQRMMR